MFIFYFENDLAMKIYVMSNLETKIQEQLSSAIKERDSVKMSALRSIKTAIMEVRTSVNGKKDLDDSDIIKIIQKSAKQREESAKIYKENSRDDLYNNEIAELDVLKSFLPKMMSAEETERVVRSVIETVGASSMKDMGKVMSEINANYTGQVDRGEVSKLVKTILSK